MHLHLRDEKLVSIIVIALVMIGLGLVIYLMTSGPVSWRGFTEVYFENVTALPKVLRVGEPVNITFTIASHEMEPLNYNYTIFFGDKRISGGTITLDPSQSVMITYTFVPNSTTLILYDNYTSRKEVILPAEFYELVPISDNLSMVYGNRTFNLIKGNYILVPSPLIPSAFLMLPLSRLPLHYMYTDTYRVGNPKNLTVTESGVASFGYDKVITEYLVTKRGSNGITIQCYTHYIKYRYKFKKVSVKVISSKGTKYEIHSWVVVTGPPPH